MGHISRDADLCSSSLRQLRDSPILDTTQIFSPATTWHKGRNSLYHNFQFSNRWHSNIFLKVTPFICGAHKGHGKMPLLYSTVLVCEHNGVSGISLKKFSLSLVGVYRSHESLNASYMCTVMKLQWNSWNTSIFEITIVEKRFGCVLHIHVQCTVHVHVYLYLHTHTHTHTHFYFYFYMVDLQDHTTLMQVSIS